MIKQSYVISSCIVSYTYVTWYGVKDLCVYIEKCYVSEILEVAFIIISV